MKYFSEQNNPNTLVIIPFRIRTGRDQVRMFKRRLKYRVSQKTWEFSDEFDIVFVMN